MKKIVKKLVPQKILDWRARRIVARQQEYFGSKSAAETFTEIYQNNLWGGAKGEFYSGSGSDEKYAARYAATIRNFIFENNIKKAVDLGCGDFRVASRFVSADFHYTGCDVVPSLIEHLNEKYANENIEFRRADIIEDRLPDADLCLIRQVLQHLSNREIARILKNAEKYKYLIVTESYPRPGVEIVPNLDIPHGPDIRLHFDSAVCLDQPPYGLTNIKLLLDAEADEGTRIKTFVIER